MPKKGVVNNPKGKPKLNEPTKILYKRVPESIFVECLKFVTEKIKNHKNGI
ncbi:hypothetical protein [Flavobacterium sp.]|jgi:hypothetical protein|uniref:hypothetical protein n=1 Tax=Flavobacterium sp. TaxID=239 RepID=UPI0037BF00EF